jgi:phosphoacetylglucosamine mutase
MKYGTSGFRDKSKEIINISYKIGQAMCNLVLSNNKNYGIMITASHNYYEDNGVKIIENTGNMISKRDENFIEDYVNNLFELDKIIDVMTPKYIYIGYDTRSSCNNIKLNIIKGIKSVCNNINIIDFGKVTTPQHHYLVSVNSHNPNDYISKFNKLINFNLNFSNITIDCANGIGYYPLCQLKSIHNLEYKLINTDVHNHQLLNHNSGTDYVISSNNLPSLNIVDSFGCSLDGDADRFIFYYYDMKLNILDGDYIAMLYILMLTKILNKNPNKYTFGFIHTPYTNKAVIEWVKKINDNIQIECTATGVKNLHHAALKYDISVYFESNGHGTLLINNLDLNQDDDIYKINILNNKVVGDGISGIFCVLNFLKELNMSYKDWFNLLVKNNNLLYKKEVKDKSIFKTNDVGDRLLEPVNIQNMLDDIMKKYDCYCFIRPSGTEDIIRIYIEGKTNLFDIRKEIDDYLE